MNVCEVMAYADGTTLVFPVRTGYLSSDIQLSLIESEKIVSLFESFGLSVNASKTNITLFRSTRKHLEFEPEVSFCGSMLRISSTANGNDTTRKLEVVGTH